MENKIVKVLGGAEVATAGPSGQRPPPEVWGAERSTLLVYIQDHNSPPAQWVPGDREFEKCHAVVGSNTLSLYRQLSRSGLGVRPRVQTTA